jgi:hypothetical protein
MRSDSLAMWVLSRLPDYVGWLQVQLGMTKIEGSHWHGPRTVRQTKNNRTFAQELLKEAELIKAMHGAKTAVLPNN